MIGQLNPESNLLRRALGFVAFIVVLFGSQIPALANNTFPGTIISGTGSLSASNVGATAETGEPGAWPAINSMWYSWTAASAGTLVVQTCSATATTFDTTLAAYTGALVNALTLLASNDDTGGCATSINAGYGSRVTLQVTQGVTYRIQVDGYASNSGNFLLQYAFTPAAITVVTTDTSATEGGDTAAFTVRLATQPSANTTVTIAADPSGQCTFAPATLTFTTANWATVQTVTATAINDTTPEGVHSCSPGSISASGSNYSTVTGTPPVLTVNDNDQGILVAQTDAAATEGGDTGAFTVKLATQPTATVTVTIAADPATPDQCTFSPTTLTFTASTWNALQTVTATAVDDALVEGAHGCSTGTISSVGGDYAGRTAPAQNFTITDNDVASLAALKSASVASVSMPGDVIGYTIRITNTGNVIALNISVSDSLSSVTCPTSGTNIIALLIPAAVETCTASYTATQADFDSNGGGDGDIDNSALAAGTAGGVPVSAGAVATVASPQLRSMTFEKTSPAPTPLVVNQVVTYSFKVRNTGNVTLTDVSINEELFNGALPLGTPAGETLTDNAPLNTPSTQSQDSPANNGVWSELKPNDEVTFTLNYVVQQVDVDLLQ